MLNLKSYKLIIFIFLCSVVFRTVAQTRTTNLGIAFSKGCIHLTQRNKLLLDSFIISLISVNEKDSLFMFKEFHLVLFSAVSVKEYKKRSKLGVLRCKAIIDYIQDKYKIPRSYFLICDSNSPNFYPIIEIGFFRKVP